jgi:hypothetical protein
MKFVDYCLFQVVDTGAFITRAQASVLPSRGRQRGFPGSNFGAGARYVLSQSIAPPSQE